MTYDEANLVKRILGVFEVNTHLVQTARIKPGSPRAGVPYPSDGWGLILTSRSENPYVYTSTEKVFKDLRQTILRG